VGREQRVYDLTAAHEAEVRPHLAFVEDRLARTIRAFGRNLCQLVDRGLLRVGERCGVGEEGRRVGPLVDALQADRPSAAAEVPRVPREAAGAVLLDLVAQRARVALLMKLQDRADR